MKLKSYFFSIKYLLFFINLIFIGLLLGCGGEPPEIGDVFVKINLFKDIEQRRVYQKLSLFIVPDDPDGFDDLMSLYIIHDASELYWSLDNETWQKTGDKKNLRIGSSSFVMPDFLNFPDGEYRILLEDLSGSLASKSIFIYKNDIKINESNFPGSYIKNNTIYVKSRYRDNNILIYNKKSIITSSFNVKEEGIPINTILSKVSEPSFDLSYFVYAYYKKKDVGLITGPFYYNIIQK